MEDNYIQLKGNDVLRFKIKTKDGVLTGDTIEFNLDDISLLLKYNEIGEKSRKNKDWLDKEFIIINKRQDSKKKDALLTKNEEDKIKALKEYYEKQIEVYNIFLGENGVQKLLYGRPLGITTLREIDSLITNDIMPKLKQNAKDLDEMIKEKYSTDDSERLV